MSEKSRTRTTITKQKSVPKANVTLRLRRKTSEKKKTHRRRIFSWVGYEELQQRLRSAAHRYREADRQLESKYDTDAIIGGTIQAKTGSSQNPDFSEAADALNQLVQLHTLLVLTHGLDCDFVRREWVQILSSNEQEHQRVSNLVDAEQMKSSEEDLADLQLS
eukprot:TRINITY_DN4770_c0_g2_i1.p1 TRINITY_DN4770_c0_g2~~TRINITY_DN4770_c0_g2_i1.p1  ORF type:complete len:163 (-),score=20.12 TRINITY_DN4770_c0_g2_i1:70-558(-)